MQYPGLFSAPGSLKLDLLPLDTQGLKRSDLSPP